MQPRHIVRQLIKDIVLRPDMSTQYPLTQYASAFSHSLFPLTMDLSRLPIKNGTVSSICSAFKNLINTCHAYTYLQWWVDFGVVLYLVSSISY